MLDTYQANLNEALQTVTDASQQDLTIRQAEAAGLARGYWQILAPANINRPNRRG